VLELSPPHRMVWSWRGAEDPATTRLVIELEAHDTDGTRLTLRHTGEADEPTRHGHHARLDQQAQAAHRTAHRERRNADD